MVRILTDGPTDWVVTAYGRVVARFHGPSAVYEACRWVRRYEAA